MTKKQNDAQNLGELIQSELNRKITINEAGESVELSKAQIIIKRVINESLKEESDHKTLMSLLTLLSKLYPDISEVEEHNPKEDQEIIDRFVERKIEEFLQRNKIKLTKSEWK